MQDVSFMVSKCLSSPTNGGSYMEEWLTVLTVTPKLLQQNYPRLRGTVNNPVSCRNL